MSLPPDPTPDLGSDASPGSQTLELANEYALVRVRQVQTRNGVRLEIVAPRLGRAIRLCPVELESLTWQSHETFSAFLETPFGPEGDVEA
ncbi:MAG: dihydrodiol dehydrogenase [Gemmatimonadetes bacterium]|nr:dihydrodiol dehydrogenase [Gemmatimonadota bacterium]